MYSETFSTIDSLDQTDITIGRTFDSKPKVDKVLTKTGVTTTIDTRFIPTAYSVHDKTGETFARKLLTLPFEQHTEAKRVASGTALTELPSIYFKREPISVEFRRAIQLLDQARDLVADAKGLLSEGQVLQSDEKIMEFSAYLPELFCLRTLSESFGAVINAVQNAITNRRGTPLSETDLDAVDELLKSLVREPGMTFERAVAKIMKFEESGFVVESPALGGFLGLVEAFQAEFPNLYDQA